MQQRRIELQFRKTCSRIRAQPRNHGRAGCQVPGSTSSPAKHDAHDSPAILDDPIRNIVFEIEDDTSCSTILSTEERGPNALYSRAVDLLFFKTNRVLDSVKINHKPVRLVQFKMRELRTIRCSDPDLKGISVVFERYILYNVGLSWGCSVNGKSRDQ